MLRTMQKMVYPESHSMRVVAENALDATSRLALNPSSTHQTPDYVNVQKLYARVLTQALAYPWLYSAVAQLIFNTPGTPRLRFYNVGEELIPVGHASFAKVVETVRRA